MSDDTLEYYERRARQEIAAADASVTTEAESAHRLLAIQYEAEARELRKRQPRPKLTIR